MYAKITMNLSDTENEVEGAGWLLRKYLSLLVGHVSDTLSIATSLATINTRLTALTCTILQRDITGMSICVNF